MIKKFLIIVVMVFACGTLHAQEYDPYKEYRYDYEGENWRGTSTNDDLDYNHFTEGPTAPVTPDHNSSIDVKCCLSETA